MGRGDLGEAFQGKRDLVEVPIYLSFIDVPPSLCALLERYYSLTLWSGLVCVIVPLVDSPVVPPERGPKGRGPFVSFLPKTVHMHSLLSPEVSSFA